MSHFRIAHNGVSINARTHTLGGPVDKAPSLEELRNCEATGDEFTIHFTHPVTRQKRVFTAQLHLLLVEEDDGSFTYLGQGSFDPDDLDKRYPGWLTLIALVKNPNGAVRWGLPRDMEF